MNERTLLALGATAALAFACQRAESPKLDEMVRAELSKEPALAATDVHVTNNGGHVFLSGRVRRLDQRKIAGELADDVKGVDRVTNDIQVDETPEKPQ